MHCDELHFDNLFNLKFFWKLLHLICKFGQLWKKIKNVTIYKYVEGFALEQFDDQKDIL